jgi:Na+-driven multidrug efflux pump
MLAFTWITGVAFGKYAATLVGQARGGTRPEAAVRAGWRASGLALGVAVVRGGACALLPGTLAGLVTVDADLGAELVPFLIVMALAQPFLQSHFTLGGAHRGAGDTFTPFVAAALGNWALRVPLAFYFAHSLEAPVVWIWAIILGDHAIRAAWLGVSYARGVLGLPATKGWGRYA